MQFNVENGTGQITLGMSDIGSYLKMGSQVVVDWYDCKTDGGRYCCLFNDASELLPEFSHAKSEELHRNYTGKEDELYALLQPLFKLLKNGTYNLHYIQNEGGHFFKYQTLQQNEWITYLTKPVLVFPKLSVHEQSQDTLKRHLEFSASMNAKGLPTNLLSQTTSWYGDFWQETHFIASKTFDTIDKVHVEQYKKILSSGLRPFILLISGSGFAEKDHPIDAPYFVLDGHHKLLAYEQLGIPPPIALINYLPETSEEIAFDAELLAEKMHPWQAEHLISNWEYRLPYLKEKMSNPNSPLFQFIKHGWSEEKYPNGQLKEEAYYEYGIITGKFKTFHPNGKLESVGEYLNGRLLWRKKRDKKGRLISIEQHYGNQSKFWKADKPAQPTEKRRRKRVYVSDKLILLILLGLGLLFASYLMMRL